LTYFFVAEWRAKDVHADVGGDSPQLGHVSGKKAPPLDILEEAFETAGGECRREADAVGLRTGRRPAAGFPASGELSA
jgi:hypothetical protein